MPDKEFLENYPLYRRFEMQLSEGFKDQHLPPLNMYCDNCKSRQTFNFVGSSWLERESVSDSILSAIYRGPVHKAIYSCASCSNFRHYFFLEVNTGDGYVKKVGQFPPWTINVETNIEKALGEHLQLYKKGLICESQGYGVGAFAYYRRVIEEVIDSLLEQIGDLIPENEKSEFENTLSKVREQKVAEGKIQLAQDMLPPILKPEGMNPLATLYDNLSQGLHGMSDEWCLESAMEVREVLIFLVQQVTQTRDASRQFTDRMRKLLEKKKAQDIRT